MSDLISRQDAKDAIDMALDHIDHVPPWVYDKLLNALNEVPSVEPETPSNGSITYINPENTHDRTMSDLISRQDVLHELDGCDYELKDWQRWKLKTMVRDIPSAEKAQLSEEDATKDVTSDLISKKEATTIPVMPKEHREYQTMNLDDAYEQGWFDCQKCIEELPSAEPERLTDDDFETIRIHLNAQKEKLCNQQRWEEAEEYQRIIDRFMAFASAQPEIIRCGQCKYAEAADSEDNQDGYTCQFHRGSIWFSGSYCSWAERREECTP